MSSELRAPSSRGPWNSVYAPSSVTFRDTDFELSEGDPYAGPGELAMSERDQSLAVARVTFKPPGIPTSGSQRLTFENCRFSLGPDVESGDDPFVAVTADEIPDGVIRVVGGGLGSGFRGFFAPVCAGCQHVP